MGTGLIKIVENEDGSRAVNARDLHRFLIVEAKGGQKGEDFSTWIKRSIGHVKALENTDYVVLDFDYKGLPRSRESDNQVFKVHKREYALSLSLAKEIAMVQNNDKGTEARLYFIECEKRLKNKIVTLPSYQIEDSIDRAHAWIEEEKERNQLRQRNIVLEPRSKFFEQIVLAEGLLSMEQTAKLLNIKDLGRNNLFKALREGGVLQKDNNSPLQHYMSKGYFELKEDIIVAKNIRKAVVTTYVTQKGLAFLFKFFGLTEIKNNEIYNR